MQTDEQYIEGAWLSLMEKLKVRVNSSAEYSKLVRAYQERGRYYHTLGHIRQCLELVDRVRHILHHESTVRFALLFHDLVYDIKKEDKENVNLSAEAAHAAAVELDVLSAGFKHDIKTYIMATHHDDRKLVTVDEEFIADIDLAILGGDEEAYDRYRRGVRMEYASIPDDVFYPRRLAILEGLRARPELYRTELFKKRYLDLAHRNLDHEIREIGALINA